MRLPYVHSYDNRRSPTKLESRVRRRKNKLRTAPRTTQIATIQRKTLSRLQHYNNGEVTQNYYATFTKSTTMLLCNNERTHEWLSSHYRNQRSFTGNLTTIKGNICRPTHQHCANERQEARDTSIVLRQQLTAAKPLTPPLQIRSRIPQYLTDLQAVRTTKLNRYNLSFGLYQLYRRHQKRYCKRNVTGQVDNIYE